VLVVADSLFLLLCCFAGEPERLDACGLLGHFFGEHLADFFSVHLRFRDVVFFFFLPLRA
jgi:hypothetical protein